MVLSAIENAEVAVLHQLPLPHVIYGDGPPRRFGGGDAHLNKVKVFDIRESNERKMHASIVEFGANYLREEEVASRDVLEIGSRNVNGSLRPQIEEYGPERYLGIDFVRGPMVDVVARAEDVVDIFGEERFDVVVCTEVMEHVKNWRTVVRNIKRVCKPGGIILLTTRSKGFPYHAHPHDYWRYELEDVRNIFSDCDILELADDPQAPGVFAKIRRPEGLEQISLADYELHSIIAGHRKREFERRDYRTLHFRRTYAVQRTRDRVDTLLQHPKFVSFLKSTGLYDKLQVLYRAVFT